MSIDPKEKASLLEDVNAKYEASKNSFSAMERSISQMDTKIATTKAEKASIDNLPPIPAGPAFIAENEGDPEPVEKKAGLDRATVTKLVTDDMKEKGLIDKLEGAKEGGLDKATITKLATERIEKGIKDKLAA